MSKGLKIADKLTLATNAQTSTFVVYGGKGMGKRLALDTPLATPGGWTTMGEVAVGDLLFDERGEVCRVTYVSPVVVGDSYAVRFSDGTEIVADAEHLWATEDYKARKRGAGHVIRTTAEIRDTLIVRPRQPARNHSIRTTQPLRCPVALLPVDPYVLGMWLGDGSSNAAVFTAGTVDIEETRELLQAAGCEMRRHRVQPSRAPHMGVVGLKTRLRALGVLANKHVPQMYLRASRDQRLALLQGLLDSDGGVDGSVVRFDNKNKRLADAVYELAVSLGMKATRAERIARLYGKECGLSHRVTIVPTMSVFRLARKASGLRFDRTQAMRRERRYIAAVNKVRDVPMRCISVDSPNRLYLAGAGMVPTHNTNFMAVLAEELSRANLRFSVLDPVGVSWGLQHGATRDKPGLPVLILGGIHGDIPIEPSAGGVVADLVTDEAVSTVIDISRRPGGEMWSASEQTRFVADYADRLYQRQGEQRVPILQIIDECGRFCPQTLPHGAVEIARCLGAIERLVEWGRNVGVGVCLVTQRSARMNKSVSELADCMIAFRTVGPRSVDAILDWLGEHIEKARHKELLEQLRKLDVGHALVVSPGWLKFEGLARVRQRETFDSSKTPEPGKRTAVPGKAAKPDLEKYRQRMAETVEKAAANDPAELKKRIALLQKQLQAQKPAGGNTALEAETAELRARVEKLEEQNSELFEIARCLVADLGDAFTNIVGPARQTLALMRKGALPTRAEVAQAVPRPSAKPQPAPSPAKPLRAAPGTASSITGPEQRIVDAIAWLESVGVEAPEQTAVAFLAGYTAGGGAFNNPRGRLNQTGMVEYVPGGRIKLTEAGRGAAHVPDAPLSSEELHGRVLERLPGPEQRLLRPLLAAYPEAMTNDELAKAAGYIAGAGAFNNPRGRLRSLGLIEYTSPGCARARDILFLEGR